MGINVNENLLLAIFVVDILLNALIFIIQGMLQNLFTVGHSIIDNNNQMIILTEDRYLGEIVLAVQKKLTTWFILNLKVKQL
jgi:hypothetical protein